ncbi:MAG: CBS domain-containing protein [Flavobacteriales bacterium]|nr:MAG: CBS domain-containing protein [Flavobacteriales bacterium]
MKKREPISSIMTSSVITINLNDHLRDVKKKFSKENIRHLPVMNGDELVGMISKNDIMRLSFGSIFDNQENADEAVLDMLSVDQVMTHNPKSIAEDALIRDAAEIFVSSHFHSLPVVNAEGKIAGIVTSTDVIRYLLEQM